MRTKRPSGELISRLPSPYTSASLLIERRWEVRWMAGKKKAKSKAAPKKTGGKK